MKRQRRVLISEVRERAAPEYRASAGRRRVLAPADPRFNPPGTFEVLYAALDVETALAEREGILLSAPGVRLARGVRTGVLLRIGCRLSRVLDLRDERVRERLGLTP